MKLPALILLALCLSSCFYPVYNRLDSKEGSQVNTRFYKADFSMIKHYLRRSGDYQVIVYLTPTADLKIRPADIQVEMPGEKLTGIKLWDTTLVKTYDRRWLSALPDIDPSQPLDLKTGELRKLIYSFEGKHHKQLSVRMKIKVGGESITREVNFEKRTEFQFLH